MTEKMVKVGGTEVRMRASALIPRLYRFKFGRDMISDMKLLQKDAKAYVDAAAAGDTSSAEFTVEDFTVFENVAYMMAKHADPSVPSDIEAWLEQFDGVLDIYEALPDIFDLWAANQMTTSVPVKK